MSEQECIKCGKCNVKCPLYIESREEKISPRGMLAVAEALEKGTFFPKEKVKDAFTACTFCRRCGEDCPVGIIPFERIADALRRWGRVRRTLHRVSRRIIPAKGVETVILAGCTIERKEGLFADALKNLRLMIRNSVLARGYCCGAPFIRCGDFSLAAFALARIARFSCNAQQVITLCPRCAATLDESSRRFRIHIPQVRFMGELTRFEGQKRRGRVFHFGGCVSEARGWAERVRSCLRLSGLEVVYSEKILCCGKGSKDIGDVLLNSLTDEYKKSGCELLLTDCPLCLDCFCRAGIKAKLSFLFL
ncbi:MAG: (Fe-S)-binding protein [Planctomycetota bacterium]|nr:(Fe-S)-binding protein [Planctomycetota bacterium]